MDKELSDRVDYTEEICDRCMDYLGSNKCSDGHNVEEVRKEGVYACFARHVSVMSYSGRKVDLDPEDT